MPITELRIEGLRTLEKIRLDLDGLTVLIGDNGAGKSSILEACEILRRATGPRFMDELYGIHGGLTALLRQGAPRLMIGVTIRLARDDFSPQAHAYHPVSESIRHTNFIEYDLEIVPSSTFATLEETIRSSPKEISIFRTTKKHKKSTTRADHPSTPEKARVILKRTATKYKIPANVGALGGSSSNIEAHLPFLATLLGDDATDEPPFSEAQCVAAYLRNLRVHIPFETMPAWAARALDRKSALRTPALLTPATHLEKLGVNLASAYHALKNSFGRGYWDDTLSYQGTGARR